MRVISSTVAGDNEAGLDLASRYLSSAKTAALRTLGLRIVQGRRDGVRVWDLDGNAYLDCRSAGGVFDFGHRPQFAIEALTRALEEIGDIGDWLLFSAVRARGAEALARVLPGDLHYSFFTPGGGEAIEVACKLARAVTGRAEIVTAEHGFHGQVGFALAMDEERETKWFAPLVPGITKVPFRRSRCRGPCGERRNGGGVHGDDPGDCGVSDSARRLLARRAGDLRRARRALDPRRGAGRSRPHGNDMGLRTLGRRSRPPRDGQGIVGRRVSDIGVLFR